MQMFEINLCYHFTLKLINGLRCQEFGWYLCRDIFSRRLLCRKAEKNLIILIGDNCKNWKNTRKMILDVTLNSERWALDS